MARKYTFPKKTHITQNQEFRKIISTGRKIKNAEVTLFYKKEGKHNAFGVSISKKIKGAVFRNRLKRLAKEFFRLHQGKFYEGLKVIAYIQHAKRNIRYRDMADSLGTLVQKSGLEK